VLATDVYEVLAEGLFSPLQLKLHILGERCTYSEALEQTIEGEWTRAVGEAEKTGRLLFNGKLFRLLRYEVRSPMLNLLLGETDYRELIGTSRALCAGLCTEEKLAKGLALSSTILTKDGFLLLGRRSRKVWAGRGRLHVCAGHPDPERQLSVDAILSGKNPFFGAMECEIAEETGVTPDRIEAMVCRGLVQSRGDGKAELIFETSLKLSRAQLLRHVQKARDRSEHAEFFTVPADGPSLSKFLLKHHEDFTAPGLAAVVFFGLRRGYWTSR